MDQPAPFPACSRSAEGEKERERRPLASKTCLQTSRVPRVEGSGPTPSVLRCAGPQATEVSRAEAPLPAPPRPGGRALGPREGGDACLQTRGRERRESAPEGGRGCRQRGHWPAGSSARTLTPPAVAHPVPSSLPRFRLRGLLLSGRRRRGIQPGPSPPPPGRDPTMHFFSHPHWPTLPCGMRLGEEGRAGSPGHNSWVSVRTAKR